MKAAPTCFGSHKTIIREPYPVLSYVKLHIWYQCACR